jgi:hypothetical protein
MYTPGLPDALQLEPVSMERWAVNMAIALSLFVGAELHKLLLRRRTS